MVAGWRSPRRGLRVESVRLRVCSVVIERRQARQRCTDSRMRSRESRSGKSMERTDF